MWYKGSWSCLDLLGVCYGTTLQHITSIDQKQTPPLCIYCFFCDRNCTTQSNTTIVWSPWRAISGSRKKGKQQACTRIMYVFLMTCLLIAYPPHLNRSGIYTLCSPTTWNLTSVNTKQGLGLFSDTIQCLQECHSSNCQTRSGNHSIWQSLSFSRRRSYDWSSFC